MNYFSLEIRNPYYYKRKFPIALVHFTAGFLLLDAWYGGSVRSFAPVLSDVLFVIAIFEFIYTFFAFKLMLRYPLFNSVVRLIVACAFLVYGVLLFSKHQILFGVFMVLIGCAFIIISFIESRWAKPFIIRINDRGVLFPGTFKTPLIPWRNFNHVMLRDSLLTLDMASNKVIQLELNKEPEEQQIIDFNIFCKNKIDQHKL